KERIPRKYRPRLVRMIYLRQQIRHVLRRMPWRVAGRYDHFAKLKSVAIFDFLGVKTVLCAPLAAGVNLCGFQSRAEFARPADKIGMNRGLKIVGNTDACLPRRFNVHVAISSWIEYRRNSFVVVADKIRKLSDSFSLNCLKY